MPAWLGRLRAPPPSGTRRRRRGRSAGRPARSALPGPRPPGVGLAAARQVVVVDREREHVGGTVAAEEAAVEVGDRLLVDEDQRHLGVGRRALLRQHHAGEAEPARQVDLEGRLLVGREDGHQRSVVRPLVRVHDVLDDLVADDVVGVELDEREVGDAVEDRRAPRAARCGRDPRAGRSG